MKPLTKNQWVAVVVVLAVFGYLLFFGGSFNVFQTATTAEPTSITTSNTSMDQTDTSNEAAAINSPNGGAQQLVATDVVVGKGAEAVAGKTVTVDYTGTLVNGTVFDSSIPRGQPFVFQLGAGQVIAGWDKGVAGMKVGGERKLIIPAAMAYGAQAMTDSQGNVIIPANATLVFDVKLLGVK